jgi:hypothetical protein
VSINDLYREFKETCSEWALPVGNLPRKRHKVNPEGGSSEGPADDPPAPAAAGVGGRDGSVALSSAEVMLRCRFFQALSDIEKTGLIKIRRLKDGSLILDRLIFSWMQT